MDRELKDDYSRGGRPRRGMPHYRYINNVPVYLQSYLTNVYKQNPVFNIFGNCAMFRD